MKQLSYQAIRACWRIHKLPIKATQANIRLAVERTRNCFGITVRGVPYVKPAIGMRVETSFGDKGVIRFINGGRGEVNCHSDPECGIKTDSGKTLYLFQTALMGYKLLPMTIHKSRLPGLVTFCGLRITIQWATDSNSHLWKKVTCPRCLAKKIP